MGEMIRVVELGGSYWLEYQSEKSGWQMKTKELSVSDVGRYEALMDKLQSMELELLNTFID